MNPNMTCIIDTPSDLCYDVSRAADLSPNIEKRKEKGAMKNEEIFAYQLAHQGRGEIIAEWPNLSDDGKAALVDAYLSASIDVEYAAGGLVRDLLGAVSYVNTWIVSNEADIELFD